MTTTAATDTNPLLRGVIRRNAIRCRHCGDVVESHGQHDFHSCWCGKVAVDGGQAYLGRTGFSDDAEELSVVDRPSIKLVSRRLAAQREHLVEEGFGQWVDEAEQWIIREAELRKAIQVGIDDWKAGRLDASQTCCEAARHDRPIDEILDEIEGEEGLIVVGPPDIDKSVPVPILGETDGDRRRREEVFRAVVDCRKDRGDADGD